MAKRRAVSKPKPEQLQLPSESAGAEAPATRVFPHQLRPGDVYRDAAGREWTVAVPPSLYRGEKRVVVRFGVPGESGREPCRGLGGSREGDGEARESVAPSSLC